MFELPDKPKKKIRDDQAHDYYQKGAMSLDRKRS